MLGPRWIRRRGIEKSKKETHFTLPHTRVQVIADRHGRGIGAVIRLLNPRWVRRRGIEAPGTGQVSAAFAPVCNVAAATRNDVGVARECTRGIRCVVGNM